MNWKRKILKQIKQLLDFVETEQVAQKLKERLSGLYEEMQWEYDASHKYENLLREFVKVEIIQIWLDRTYEKEIKIMYWNSENYPCYKLIKLPAEMGYPDRYYIEEACRQFLKMNFNTT